MGKNTHIKELIIQRKLERETGGGHTVCPAGYTDIVTDKMLIEIKKWNDWKSAIGQIMAYRVFYPNRKCIIYFFGYRPNHETVEVIKRILELNDIEMREDESVEDEKPVVSNFKQVKWPKIKHKRNTSLRVLFDKTLSTITEGLDVISFNETTRQYYRDKATLIILRREKAILIDRLCEFEGYAVTVTGKLGNDQHHHLYFSDFTEVIETIKTLKSSLLIFLSLELLSDRIASFVQLVEIELKKISLGGDIDITPHMVNSSIRKTLHFMLKEPHKNFVNGYGFNSSLIRYFDNNLHLYIESYWEHLGSLSRLIESIKAPAKIQIPTFIMHTSISNVNLNINNKLTVKVNNQPKLEDYEQFEETPKFIQHRDDFDAIFKAIRESEDSSICLALVLSRTQMEKIKDKPNPTREELNSYKKTRLLESLHVDPSVEISPEFIRTYQKRINQQQRLEKILPLIDIEDEELDCALTRLLEKDTKYSNHITNKLPDLSNVDNLEFREFYLKNKYACMIFHLMGFKNPFDTSTITYQLMSNHNEIEGHLSSYQDRLMRTYDYVSSHDLPYIYDTKVPKKDTDDSHKLKYINMILEESYGLKIFATRPTMNSGSDGKIRHIYIKGMEIWDLIKTKRGDVLVPTQLNYDPELDI